MAKVLPHMLRVAACNATMSYIGFLGDTVKAGDVMGQISEAWAQRHLQVPTVELELGYLDICHQLWVFPGQVPPNKVSQSTSKLHTCNGDGGTLHLSTIVISLPNEGTHASCAPAHSMTP